jgi:hypothetical protein
MLQHASLNISGATTLSNNVNINGTVQNQARVILSGQEFYAPSVTSTEGLAF